MANRALKSGYPLPWTWLKTLWKIFDLLLLYFFIPNWFLTLLCCSRINQVSINTSLFSTFRYANKCLFPLSLSFLNSSKSWDLGPYYIFRSPSLLTYILLARGKPPVLHTLKKRGLMTVGIRWILPRVCLPQQGKVSHWDPMDECDPVNEAWWEQSSRRRER